MASASSVLPALAGVGAPFLPCEEQNEYPSLKLTVMRSVESPRFSNAAPAMNYWQQDGLQFYPGPSFAQPRLRPSQAGHANVSGLLDTRQWSPSSNLVGSYMTPGADFPLTLMMGPQASLHEHFVSVGAPTRGMPPETRDALHPQAMLAPNAGLGCSGSVGRYENIGTTGYHQPQAFYAHQPTHVMSNVALPSPSASIGDIDITNLVRDEPRSPIVIYQSPAKPRSGRRRQRGCAVNIDGLWIDKSDLNVGAGQGNGKISVHECQWAKSSDPCGMWILPSRSRFGTHLRTWHKQGQADGVPVTDCLWEGCTSRKGMLKDSINRHVVTVHLEEEFHCQGCKQEFSRKDVYNKHVVEGDGACRDAGAVIVYGAGRRTIDARKASQREFTGDAVRFSNL